MRVPHFLFMAIHMGGTSAVRSRWGVSIYFKTNSKNLLLPYSADHLRRCRKDEKRNKNYSILPMDELISRYGVTQANKSHLKHQHSAPLRGFYYSVKGLFNSSVFLRITSSLSKHMSKKKTYIF